VIDHFRPPADARDAPSQVELEREVAAVVEDYQDVSDPFSKELLTRYDKLFQGSAKFTAGSGCSGCTEGLRLWEAAVKEAGSLNQGDVIGALDHAKLGEGPGDPAEMVPGQHHVRMNMYIAPAIGGNFKIVKSLGVIDPKECLQGVKQASKQQLSVLTFRLRDDGRDLLGGSGAEGLGS